MKKEYIFVEQDAPSADLTNIVLKSFNSTLRRFPLGATVSDSDDFTPHSYEDLKTRGFIG